MREALKEVFSNKRYVILSAVSMFSIFGINVFFHNYPLLRDSFSFTLLFYLLIGITSSMSLFSVLMLILISISGGLLLAMSIFLIRRQVSLDASVGGVGVIASIITPACGSCALGLVGLFSIGGFFSILPFKGLEIGVLGLIVTIVMIAYISKKITTRTCEITKEEDSQFWN